MKHTTTFTCSQCGKTITHRSTLTTGYGTDKNDNKICYACIGENDRKELATLPIGGKILMYLIYNGGDIRNSFTLSNWPRSFKINHIVNYKKGDHNIARSRMDVWFNFAGAKYHGVKYGYNTQIIHIKRIKN